MVVLYVLTTSSLQQFEVGEEDIASVGRGTPQELFLWKGAELSPGELELGVVYLVETELSLSPVEPPAHVIYCPVHWV